jgi:hypothetical protein
MFVSSADIFTVGEFTLLLLFCTPMVVLRVVVPAVLAQIMVKVVSENSAPVDVLPALLFDPDHPLAPPVALQVVALPELQVIVVLFPEFTED